jgi:hypothetical protein
VLCLQLPATLHLTYFSFEGLVTALVAATPEAEKLADLHQAAQQEMMYTIEQGINSRSLLPTDACMTLAQLFLFSCEMNWDETTQIEYWRTIIQLAVVSGPGLFVREVFQGDDQLSKRAFEWMMRFDRNQPFSPTRFFMQPRFANLSRIDVGETDGVLEEDAEGGENKESSRSGGVEQDAEEDVDEERHRSVVPINKRHRRNRLPAYDASMVRILVAYLESMNKHDEVVEGVRCFDPRVRLECPTLDIPSSEIDTGVLLSCLNILRTRDAALEYSNNLRHLRKLFVDKEDDRESDMETQREPDNVSGRFSHLFPLICRCSSIRTSLTLSTFILFYRRRTLFTILYQEPPSVEVNIARLVDNSELRDSPEMKHLRKYGFFVTECFPFWLISIAEALAVLPERTFDAMFKKAGNKAFHKRWDVKRKISYLVRDDPLYDLTTKPVKRMMEKFGLLAVWGQDGVTREIADCAALKSLPRPAKKAVVQGMHADTPPEADMGDRVTFSTITAGAQPSALEIYPKSWNGGMGPSGVPVRVEVPPGHTIVFHGVARHRGVSFPLGSLRFFINFVVPVAVKPVVEQTSVLEKWQFQEKDAISFDAWKKRFES